MRSASCAMYKTGSAPTSRAADEGLRLTVSCPITAEMYEWPVVTVADGHSYERDAIAKWFSLGSPRSPTTSLPLPTTKTIPNTALRLAVQEVRLRLLAGSGPDPQHDYEEAPRGEAPLVLGLSKSIRPHSPRFQCRCT
jgi:hypothetical protein